MKKIGKKPIGLASIVLIAVLTGVVAIMFSGGSGGISRFTVYAAGTPDSYGNRIGQVLILQNSTGIWTSIASVDYSTYTPGYTLSVPANQHTVFEVVVWLNMTLAADLTTAQSRVRVYLNITGVTTNFNMIKQGGYGSSPYWIVYTWYPAYPSGGSMATTWIPATDTTYATTAQYQAYY